MTFATRLADIDAVLFLVVGFVLITAAVAIGRRF